MHQISLWRQSRSNLEEQMRIRYGLNEQEMELLKSSKSNAETVNVITRSLMRTNKQIVDENGNLLTGQQLLQDINSYALKWFEKTVKVKEAHKDVLNMTKELREGYLSVFNEVTVGFKEFEKYIGGIDKGMTQMMTSQENAWGTIINTMAAGAMIKMQDETGKLAEGYMARMDPAARFVYGRGLVPISHQRAMRQLGDISGRPVRREGGGFDQTQSLLNQLRTGEIYGRQGRQAHLGMSPLTDTHYLGAQAQATMKGVKETGMPEDIRAIRVAVETEGLHPAVRTGQVRTHRAPVDPETHFMNVMGITSERRYIDPTAAEKALGPAQRTREGQAKWEKLWAGERASLMASLFPGEAEERRARASRESELLEVKTQKIASDMAKGIHAGIQYSSVEQAERAVRKASLAAGIYVGGERAARRQAKASGIYVGGERYMSPSAPRQEVDVKISFIGEAEKNLAAASETHTAGTRHSAAVSGRGRPY